MIMSPLVRDVRVPFEGILSNPRLDHAECVAVADDGLWWCGGEAGQIFRIADGVIEQVASTVGSPSASASAPTELCTAAIWPYLGFGLC
jgi:hypothetical protein